METLSYCQLMERMLAAEARVVELTAENVGLVDALESEKRICSTWSKTAEANSEKLEKAQQRIATQREYYEGVIADGCKRIAELESRTVNVETLQESAYRAGLTAGWNLGLANNNDGFNKCLAAHVAGIKWEAE